MPRILNGYWAAGTAGAGAWVGKVGSRAPLASWTNAGGTCWLKPGLITASVR